MVTFGEMDTFGCLLKNGHVWAFIHMICIGAVLQLDKFCSSVSWMWTRLGESDNFGGNMGKDTFPSVTYIYAQTMYGKMFSRHLL